MPLLIPVGFGQAVYEYRLDDDTEPIVNTCGHDLSAVVGGDFQEAANLLHSAWGARIMPIVGNSYYLTAVTLYVGQDGGPPAIYESTLPDVQGGGPVNEAPQNCAYLVRKRTSAAGRRGRGRFYIPGCDEGQITHAGAIAPIRVDQINAAFEDWHLELLSDVAPSVPMPPVVLHRSEGLGTEPPPTPITAFDTDSRIATQRRRLRK